MSFGRFCEEMKGLSMEKLLNDEKHSHQSRSQGIHYEDEVPHAVVAQSTSLGIMWLATNGCAFTRKKKVICSDL